MGKPDGGPYLQLLENEFCQIFNVPYAVAVNSATSGLHAALVAAGVGFGDRVLVPAITMTATASAVYMCGAIPVFVDVDPLTGISGTKEYLDAYEWAVNEWDIERPKAIMVVHLFGQVAPVEEIADVFQSTPIIEDCAQAPGSVDPLSGKWAGAMAGIGVFSLNQHKVIRSGEGGVCVTRHTESANRMRLVRNHGEFYQDEILGYNYRMTELQAAVGYAEISQLFKRNLARKKACSHLSELLEDQEIYQPMDVKNPPFVYALIENGDQGGTPPGFTRGYSKPLCCVPYFKSRNEMGCLPGAHQFFARVLWREPPKSKEEAEKIAKEIKKCSLSPST